MARNYHKLVRDKIPEIIKNKGGTPIIHIADKKEYWQKLKAKLSEEVAEFQKDESMEELADILEVVDAIIAFKKFSKKKLVFVQKQKAANAGNLINGLFSKGHN